MSFVGDFVHCRNQFRCYFLNLDIRRPEITWRPWPLSPWRCAPSNVSHTLQDLPMEIPFENGVAFSKNEIPGLHMYFIQKYFSGRLVPWYLYQCQLYNKWAFRFKLINLMLNTHYSLGCPQEVRNFL